MNYQELLQRDLELGTGPVEGAIKNLMGRRMDHGGMRWIKERAEIGRASCRERVCLAV